MEPITSASAIVGLMGAITDQTIRAGGFASKQIKDAYTGVQAEQKKLAAAQNYVRRYDQRHCQVKVMPGLMKEPLPLNEIYTTVKLLDDQSIRFFVGLDDLEETYRAKGLRSFGRGDAERQDGMKVANAEQYLMVLGGPGIGKSTFLRKIGLEALNPQENWMKQIRRACIPVFIELKEFRDDTIDLKQKIAAEFETCGFPEALAFTEASLAQGKLLVLLDGLDEVPTRNLNTVIKHIEDFVDAHDQNAFVASCRIAAYRSSQGTFFNRFTDVTLAEFDDEQIEQFIRRWFRSELDQEANTADRYWELLQKDEHKATKELAQTPLLLTFLCLVYDREQIIPNKRSVLYGKALDILLSEWAAQKRLEQDPIYEGFHPDLEKVLLAEIAYDSFKNDQLFFLKDDLTRRISEFLAGTLDAPKHLDGAAVLRAIEKQQGILVERATDIYSFSHLTLQEYLTALHIAEQQLEEELIEQYLTDEHWREVFLVVSGLLKSRSIQLLEKLYSKSKAIVLESPKIIAFLKSSSQLASDCGIVGAAFERRLICLEIIKSLIFSNHNELASSESILNRDLLGEINIVLSRKIRDLPIFNVLALSRDMACMSHGDPDRASYARAVSTLWDDGYAILEVFVFLFPGKSDYFPHILESDHYQSIVIAPKAYDSHENWCFWISKVFEVIFSTLNLPEELVSWDYSDENKFYEYLYIVEILLGCRNSAVHIRKQAWIDLKARLLMV